MSDNTVSEHGDITIDASLYPTTWVVVSNGDNPVCEVGFTVVNDEILVEVTGREEEGTTLTLLNESDDGRIIIKAGSHELFKEMLSKDTWIKTKELEKCSDQ